MKKILALCLSAALMLSFGGCGGTGGHIPTGDGLTPEEGETGPSAVTTPQEQAQEMKMVYYPEESFNPYQCYDDTNRALFGLLYQGLFTIDRDYETEPVLCDHYTRSSDMKTYTFYIRQATFSDGTQVTAQDVAASLRRAWDSGYYQGRFTRVEDISVTEDGGVRFDLEVAYENLPLLLDVPIVKAAQVESDRPLGTGPYRLDSSAGELRLTKRADWWCKSDLAVNASVIHLTQAQDPAQIRDAFQFDDVSLVCTNPGSDRYADYRCDYELWDCENGVFLYLGCNLSSDLFSDPEIRAALTYAVDRDALAAEFYNGFARSASLPASPLSPFYDSGLAARYSWDSAKLTKVLSDKGLTGSPVRLVVNADDSLRLRVARRIAQMLRDCGLDVSVLGYGTADYKQALRQGGFDLYLGQTRLSPNMDLSSFFAPNGRMSYGEINDAGFYSLCMNALENSGNYFTLHKQIADDGRLVSLLFLSHAVYAERGLLTGLDPARDNVFHYSIGTSMEGILTEATEPESGE